MKSIIFKGIHVDLPTLRTEWEAQHRKSADSKGKMGESGLLGSAHHLGLDQMTTTSASDSSFDQDGDTINVDVDVVGDDDDERSPSVQSHFNQSLLKLDIFQVNYSFIF